MRLEGNRVSRRIPALPPTPTPAAREARTGIDARFGSHAEHSRGQDRSGNPVASLGTGRAGPDCSGSASVGGPKPVISGLATPERGRIRNG